MVIRRIHGDDGFHGYPRPSGVTQHLLVPPQSQATSPLSLGLQQMLLSGCKDHKYRFSYRDLPLHYRLCIHVLDLRMDSQDVFQKQITEARSLPILRMEKQPLAFWQRQALRPDAAASKLRWCFFARTFIAEIPAGARYMGLADALKP